MLPSAAASTVIGLQESKLSPETLTEDDFVLRQGKNAHKEGVYV